MTLSVLLDNGKRYDTSKEPSYQYIFKLMYADFLYILVYKYNPRVQDFKKSLHKRAPSLLFYVLSSTKSTCPSGTPPNKQQLMNFEEN